MTDMFTFIEKGIIAYKSLNVPDFTSDIFRICNELNNLLNKKVNDNYEKHIEDNSFVIHENVTMLFACFSDKLYLNLVEAFDLLKQYQENRRIAKAKYRDHYYHSIQCFLLGLSLYAQLPIFSNYKKELLTTTLFSLFVYHDLGYLYFSEDKERINNTIRSWLIGIEIDGGMISDNYKILRVCKILNIRQNEKSVLELSKGNELSEIWKDSINYTDECIIREQFRIANSPKTLEKHHSYESAVLLYRFVRTLDYFTNGLIESDAITPQDAKKTDFLEIIKAILLHDFNVSEKINIENDFLACILMFVDEIQNYGRLYQDESFNHYVILPTKVGVEFSGTGKIQIFKDESFVKSLGEDEKKKYDAFTIEEIYGVLQEKIQKESLDELFDSRICLSKVHHEIGVTENDMSI